LINFDSLFGPSKAKLLVSDLGFLERAIRVDARKIVRAPYALNTWQIAVPRQKLPA
jgi:hypothetical protein